MTARRSTDIVSGMTMTALKPRAAATMDRAIPVLPEVASTMVPPGLRPPEATASSMMAAPMRSLTLFAGLADSSLAMTFASRPSVRELRRTSGVRPMVSVMSE